MRGQTIQWPTEKRKKDKQCSKTSSKIKDRLTRDPLKQGVNSGAPEVRQFLLH
jgi:hypothetical protein